MEAKHFYAGQEFIHNPVQMPCGRTNVNVKWNTNNDLGEKKCKRKSNSNRANQVGKPGEDVIYFFS